MTMSAPEGVTPPVASTLPGAGAGAMPPKPSTDVLLEGQVGQAALHAARPDHAAMLRRVRAQ
jgi:hypothetical protein